MTLEDVHYFEDYYFGFNKQILKLIGLWPHQKPKQQFFLNSIVNFFYCTGTLLEIYAICMQSLNFSSIINHLRLMVPALCSLLCYNTGVYNYQLMRELYDRLKLDLILMKDERETKISRKYFHRQRLSTLIIAFLLYAYYVLLVLPSILYASFLVNGNMNDTRVVLPVPIEHLVKTKMQYYGMLLYQLMLVFVIITVIAAIYTSYMSLIQHACLLLGIVILKINAPFVDDLYDNQFHDSDTSHVGCDWIINIVRSYVNAVEFVKLINILSERAYLFEMGIVLFVLVIIFLYLSEMYLSEYKDIREIGTCIIYSVTTILIVYVNCYVGQMLIDHNTAISKELRQIPFYKITAKAQKLLPVLILQCAKPCALMIGGMFVSSHEFFSGLLQTSMSYAMVCHTMR